MNESLFDYQYFSVKNGVKKMNGFTPELLEYCERFVLLNKNIQFDKTSFITDISHTYPTPKGNRILYRQKDGIEELDDFSHELILVVDTAKGLCIFTGCGHNGVLNIAATVQSFIPSKKIHCLFGGFHLIDGKDFVETETTEELSNIATQLVALMPAAHFYTGHCTSEKAIEVLSKKMEGRLEPFYVGQEVIL